MRMLDGLSVERVSGDLSNVTILEKAMTGCEWIFHVAALYAYWGYTWDEFYQSNVEGTRRVLEAAAKSKVQRIVHTSSIASLGIPQDGTPGTEDTLVTLKDMLSDYKRSKFLAEEVVREFVAKGLPVVTVNPARLARLQAWLEYFHTRLIGQVKQIHTARLLLNDPQVNLADLQPGIQFGLSQPNGWLKFWLPPLE